MTIYNRSDASPGRLTRRVADAVLADHLKRQLSHNEAEKKGGATTTCARLARYAFVRSCGVSLGGNWAKRVGR
jgi:hypothetical protein